VPDDVYALGVTAAVFLIDFDNVRPDAHQPYRRRDAASAADFVRRQALQYATKNTDVEECRLRYYGGWVLKRGEASFDAEKLARWIPQVPRRDTATGLRVIVELASSLLAHPGLPFFGTLRLPSRDAPSPSSCTSQCPTHCTPRPAQKMVDMMLGVDLLTLAAIERSHAVLFSSDEDLYPAVISVSGATAKAASVTWLRPGRANGSSPNDSHLATTPLRIAQP